MSNSFTEQCRNATVYQNVVVKLCLELLNHGVTTVSLYKVYEDEETIKSGYYMVINILFYLPSS